VSPHLKGWCGDWFVGAIRFSWLRSSHGWEVVEIIRTESVECKAKALANQMRKRDAQALYLSAGFSDYKR